MLLRPQKLNLTPHYKTTIEMPRFVRIENTMVHIPSLSSVSMLSNCFGRPYLMLFYHTKTNLKIQYSSWEKCEADFSRLKEALVEVEALLQTVPLTESHTIQVVRTNVEAPEEVVDKNSNTKPERNTPLQRQLTERSTDSIVFTTELNNHIEQASNNLSSSEMS
jgi:hypothetical protein